MKLDLKPAEITNVNIWKITVNDVYIIVIKFIFIIKITYEKDINFNFINSHFVI
jgi:hypothetical protein